jgi:adenine-specific DNA-methyltransferase
MKLKANNSKQKLRGGFYTPPKMANFIIEWAFESKFKNDSPIKILEPSCGDGVFLKSLENKNIKVDYLCKAIELFESEVNLAREKIKNKNNFLIEQGDFFKTYEDKLRKQKFDLIIGNPPYIRYQYLTKKQRDEKSEILKSNGMKGNKSINAWVAFVVASIEMLDVDGKIGMVIPAELLQIHYAQDLRSFLKKELTKIDIVAFDELVFPGVQQEVIILLGEKEANKSNKDIKIKTTEFKDLNDLSLSKLEIGEYKTNGKNNNDKWTKYFLSNKQIDEINKIKKLSSSKNDKFNLFKNLALINVGITTGKNDYFCIDKKTVKKYKFDQFENTLLPLIGRSFHINGIFYTKEDWEGNLKSGEKGYLINFPENINYEDYPKKIKDYIELGEQEEVHKGYKCSIRDKWYCVPSVWSPDAFLLRRNNTFPRFVLDSIGNTVSTDTMHRINFNDNLNHKKMLLSYYNSITFAFTEIEGRSYGGGVLEILPGELRKVPLPNTQNMDMELVDELLLMIDDCMRNDGNIDEVLDVVDKRVLVDHLGVDKKISDLFRDAWKTLMNRRINRK